MSLLGWVVGAALLDEWGGARSRNANWKGASAGWRRCAGYSARKSVGVIAGTGELAKSFTFRVMMYLQRAFLAETATTASS